MMNNILQALRTIRAPLQQGEYDLHHLVQTTLESHGIPCEHEVSLARGRRIDLLCGRVGIEIKRGRPPRGKLVEQLTRYAQAERIDGLILVAEGSVDVPRTLAGKPVAVVCLNRLWGIAL